jgi:MFS family permease
MMTMNMVCFLPLFITGNEWDSPDGFILDEFDISLIISVFSIAQIIFSPMNSFISNKLGAKNAVLLGFTVLTLTTVGLGTLAKVKNPKLFMILSIILRFV